MFYVINTVCSWVVMGRTSIPILGMDVIIKCLKFLKKLPGTSRTPSFHDHTCCVDNNNIYPVQGCVHQFVELLLHDNEDIASIPYK